MTDLVIIKLGQTPADPARWGAFESGRLVEAGAAPSVAALSSLALEIPEDARVVAVLPGEQVAMRAIPSAPRQAAKLRAAARYILEDELAEPIDDLQVAVAGAPNAAAYAIGRRMLAQWIEAFDAADLAVSELTVDFACIAGAPGALVLVVDGDRLILAREGGGLAVDSLIAEAVAPSFIKEAGQAHIVGYGDPALIARFAGPIFEQRPLRAGADILNLFAASLPATSVPNFLSGEFRRKTSSGPKFGSFRRPAALAAGLGAALLATAAFGALRDGRIAERYESAAAAMHRAAFPDHAGEDIGAHARAIVEQGARAGSFLELNSHLAAALEGHPGIAIDRIRFDAESGDFAFSVRSGSDAEIEKFRAALEARGLIAADSGGYRRSGEAWVGEMTARLP